MNDTTRTFIPIREACKITSLSAQTLRKLSDTGKVKSYRTVHNQRMFHQLSLQKLIDPLFIDVKETKTYDKVNYIYARVSSKKQVEDLHRQVEYLQSSNIKYIDYTVITDVASGINFKRKGLQTILDSCLQGIIGEIVIAHRDRLCRFGYELLQFIVERSNGKIIVTDDTIDKTTEQILAEDLLSIIHIYSCRKMGKRRYPNSKGIEVETEN